jgi:hypothetical protein
MSAKRRYKASRFRANRFAASKWTVASWQPDFMHGVLTISLRLIGDVEVRAEMSGEIKCDHSLRGKVESNP